MNFQPIVASNRRGLVTRFGGAFEQLSNVVPVKPVHCPNIVHQLKMQIFHWGTDAKMALWRAVRRFPWIDQMFFLIPTDHVVGTWLDFGIKMRIPSLNEFTTRRRNRMIDSVLETGKSRTEPDNQIQILFVQCSHIALWLHSLAFHLISNSISVKLRKRRSFEHFFLYSNFMQIPRSSFKGRKRWKWVCEPNAGEIFLSAARHVQSG